MVAARALTAAPALPVIPSAVYNVTNYGAVGDGVTTNTTAIQAAINAAKTTTSGGTVEIPGGVFLCGPITLANGINLQLDSGAILRMLPFDKYPGGDVSPANFISGSSLHDVEISGFGAIDGQGSPWWRALETNSAINRPLMVNLATCTRVLIQDATFSNAPAQHFAIKGKAGNVTLLRAHVYAPSSSDPVNPSHNTDALDLAETNALIQDCVIAVGDDNVALGSSSSATAGVVVTNCAFGVGHGVSIGSYTSGGVSNLTVVNCTFTNTDQGIRIKSDRDRGGLVRNLTYLNLVMNNVQYPILIYASYTNTSPLYSSLNNLTPAIVASYPAAPVTSKTPIYRDIVISNVVATAQAGRMAGLIWGLPEMSISNLTLQNVRLTGGKTFGIYDAQGIQLIDSPVTVPPGASAVSVYNAGVVFSNSAPPTGGLTLAGASTNGVGNKLAFYNAPAGLTLTNTLDSAPALTLNGSVLKVTNNLSLGAATALNFTVGTQPAEVVVSGNLALNSVVNVTNGPGFRGGVYPLLAYGGAFSGAPALGAAPAGYGCRLDTSTAGQVNLLVTSPSRVDAWGDDSFGQAETFPALSNAVAVVAGGNHNVALLSDGTVLAWGDNGYGQCNTAGLANVVSVAAGAYHSLAALADGSVIALGNNDSNQLAVPAAATNVIAVAAGDWHSLALRADGAVVGWGDNTWGQSAPPPQATNIVALAAGARHSVALRVDGSVIAWGSDLGTNGANLGQATPPDLHRVVAIAAGGFQSLALTAEGRVIGWGDNPPPPLTNAVAIATGRGHGLAALADGTVVGWGDNTCGEITVDPALGGATAVAAGTCHSVALQGSPFPAFRMTNSVIASGGFSVTVPTLRGHPVFLASRNLAGTNWNLTVGAAGTGVAASLRDASTNDAGRLYEGRQQ